MLYLNSTSETTPLSNEDLKQGLFQALDSLGATKRKVLAIPPDGTRFYSRAGLLTRFAWDYYGSSVLTDILPALGTHTEMTAEELNRMFTGVPIDLFRSHDWRNDVVTLGRVPREFIDQVSEGKLHFDWPAQVNQLLVKEHYDLILSFGQVVPHEVIGMANYNKNIFVGTGGSEAINKSHFLGAVYGMERIMGRIDNPVRSLLDYAGREFSQNLPILYVLTVIDNTPDGTVVRGLFIGDDRQCFEQAAALSRKVNVNTLERPLQKVVVYLDPYEYRSTWLGNKSIYRSRMAMADDGELIILAPGLKEFGEDREIDRLIRKYGYVGTEKVLEFTKKNPELKGNLSAAAHLIHGSSENRFTITYCSGHLSKAEIESVNFQYADLKTMMERYDPRELKDGYNTVNGEEIFFISNPGLGLWAYKERVK